MPWSSWAREPQLWSLCSRAHVPQLLRSVCPVCPRASAPQQEEPLQWEACARQLESISHLLQLEKSPHSNKDPAQPEIKINHIYIYKIPGSLWCAWHSPMLGTQQWTKQGSPLTEVEWANRKQASGDSIWGCCLQDAGPTNTISDHKWGEGGNWDKEPTSAHRPRHLP